MITIAVDAMGGDHAPTAIVDGAAAAARDLDIHISLVSHSSESDPRLKALEQHPDSRDLPISIVDRGAPLLGVAGLAVVGHGRSSVKAVRNAIAMAYRFGNEAFIQRLEQEIAAASVPHH
jgi:fatty acid/phospholipid biosynthesis enzyme